MWIYESHLGGLYTMKEQQDFENLYCEECGDSDREIGQAKTRAEAKKLLKDTEYYEIYMKEYCEEFLDENFGKVKHRSKKRQNNRGAANE